ncbi:hypothetical protein BJ165DRAFT_1598830 [Panaeolus papilionaceus]|nr:hypothetical protein BJ165DRAFT_1598830 [Panaeolus papilionaceus]
MSYSYAEVMSNIGLPMDIVNEIIDVLGDAGKLKTIKKISCLSSFCLDRYRRPMYETVKVGVKDTELLLDELEDLADHHQWQASKVAPVSCFIRLLSGHLAVIPHIRTFHLINDYNIPATPSQSSSWRVETRREPNKHACLDVTSRRFDEAWMEEFEGRAGYSIAGYKALCQLHCRGPTGYIRTSWLSALERFPAPN